MSATVGDLTVRMGVEVDGSTAIEQLRAQIRALDNEPDPRIRVDVAEADAKIARMQTLIAQIGGQDVAIQVDANANPALAELARVQAEAAELERFSPEVRVAAETIGAERDLSRLDGILQSVTRAQYHATVAAETEDALRELQILQAQLRQLDDRPVHMQVRADTDQAIRDLQALRAQMGAVGADTVSTASSMAGMSGVLSGLGRQAVALGAGLGIAQTGMALIGRAAGFLTDAVWGANISLDQVTVRINAFTRDAGETARIMDQLKQKAADIGLPFLDLAEAVATIGPIARQTGQPLMELLDTAIMLAAVNPNEGLSGAIFAMREALSGDWMSLMDRFNMPRSIINQMKEQGVPALEIINTLLRQQGIDMQYVGQMASVADSRARTLFGNLRMAAAELGRPAFEAVSDVIDQLASYTSSQAFQNDLKAVKDFGTFIAELPASKIVEIGVKFSIPEIPEALKWAFTSGSSPFGKPYAEMKTAYDDHEAQKQHNQELQKTLELVHENKSAYQQFIDTHADDPEFIGNQEALNRAAEQYHFQQQQINDQAERFAEAERRRDSVLAQGIDRRSSAARDEGRSLAEQATMREYASDQLRRQNMETLDYVSALSAQEQAAYNVSEAMSRLLAMQDRLADGYQVGLQIQQTYNAQSAEYESQASSIEKAMQLVQERQAQGIELTEQEIFIRDHGAAALERLRGGVEDATLTAGEYAIRNGELMTVQDELNRALAAGDLTQEQYTQKLQEAYAAAGLTYDATANNSTAMTLLSDSISTNLVPTLLDLIAKLDELNGKSVTTTVETKFITTGDPSTAQMFGYQSGSGYVGITAGGNAAGGVIDRPMLSMVGEEAPAHPEYIIPTNPGRRSRALSLWMDAGHSLGVPGFADGGGPAPSSGGAGGGGTSPGAIDWSFIFAGLDTEAEDYTERAAQAFVRFFGDIEALANGDALKSAQQKLNDLFTIRQIAIDSGAGEAVVAGIDAQIAAQQAQVNAIGQVMGSEVVAGMAAAMASAEAQQQVNEALKKTLMDLSSASDPYQKVQGLGQEVQDLKDAIAVAEAMGNMDVAAELRTELEAAQNEFLQAQNALTKMLKLGLLDDATIKEMAERGGEGFRQVYDTVFGEGALAALQDGWSRLSAEQFTQLQAFVGKGKDLSDQMVASILDGLTSGALSIEQAMQLLGGEQGKLAVSQQKQLAAQLEQTEQQLMQALASGDQARIATAQENYDALMELIQAYAAATGRTVDDIVGSWRRVDTTLRNAVSGQAIRVPNAGPPSVSSSTAVASVGGYGSMREAPQTVNLQLTDGRTIATWVAYDIAREVALAPSGVGGIG